ncbi:hypothetical protein [Bacteroides sp. 519]|nr:hypothetical protein [Bacteroides sp. 519]
MNDKLNTKDIEDALKIAAVLDESEEYHIPIKELEGLALDVC